VIEYPLGSEDKDRLIGRFYKWLRTAPDLMTTSDILDALMPDEMFLVRQQFSGWLTNYLRRNGWNSLRRKSPVVWVRPNRSLR
jgi:hypothetical protein